MATLSRRSFLAATAALSAAPTFAAGAASNGHAFAFAQPGGAPLPLSAYRGRPVLIVNTATACGFAGQFSTLEQLWQRYRERGLMLIAVPSNDFGGQEPLDGAAIADAVRQSHGATYAFADKAVVRGPEAHPFYRWAAAQRPAETPAWNFHKYLVGRDGALIAGYSSRTDPVGPELIRAIGTQLSAG